MNSPGILEVRDVTKSFGGVRALADVTFTVGRQEIHSVIGPNGAGKTTLLDILTGFLKPDGGDVVLDGRSTIGVPRYRLADCGLMRTFQPVRLVPTLTVRDNIMVGGHRFTRARFLATGFRSGRARREERALGERADQIIEQLDLQDYAARRAFELPDGLLRIVALGRALAAGPRLLLLDEPVSGLSEEEADRVAVALVASRASGTTVVLVEHDVDLVMRISDRVLVLQTGRVVVDDVPAVVQDHPDAQAAYLGSLAWT